MTNPAALAHLRHELRTPLNHIIGYAEMLLEDSGSRLARLAGDLRALLDDARQVLAAVTPRRFFCTQCHVPQLDIQPIVGNDFKDVDTMLSGQGHP